MRWCARRVCEAVLSAVLLSTMAASRADAQTTPQWTLFFESQAGDNMGQGQTRSYTPADGTLTITSSTSAVSARLVGPAFSTIWSLDVSAPSGSPLLPGMYTAARRY